MKNNSVSASSIKTMAAGGEGSEMAPLTRTKGRKWATGLTFFAGPDMP